MRPRHPDSPRAASRLSLSGVLLLLAGGIAWIAVLGIALAALRGERVSPQPPTVVIQRPTLSGATTTPTLTPTPTLTLTPSATPTLAPMMTATAAPPAAPTLTPLPAATATPGGTAAPSEEGPPASVTLCAPPQGWERYTVQPDDTLFAFVLGAKNTVSVEDLLAANCLSSRMLQIGQVLYLPPGAADNAPPSVPQVAPAPSGPRVAQCPCTLRVVEGWRREQIADAINAVPVGFSGADFLAVTGPDASAPFDFLAERPAGVSLEGFLFPGTYTAQNDTTAEGFRDMLLAAFGANVSPQMRADAAAQGVSFYQALIIASIVQRESRAPESQKLIASVYYNRYRDGNRLASTVPVQYALGAPGNWWPRITASLAKSETPYNTYTQAGLPPTPVDNPGLSAILAAVYTPQTNYYYHTASCNGTGEAFAATYEEHLKNARCE